MKKKDKEINKKVRGSKSSKDIETEIDLFLSKKDKGK